MLESGSWGHSVLQTPALVNLYFLLQFLNIEVFYKSMEFESHQAKDAMVDT